MLPPRMVAALVLVVVSAAPGVAAAQGSRSNLGSPLTAEANYPYHCDYRWAAGYNGEPGAFGPGGAQEWTPTYIGPSTCTIAHLGRSGNPDTSHLVPGTGTVTVARVKSGPNPAAISIATVRSFQGRDSQGQYSNTCCQGVSETPTVTPTPNGITEIPVNFRVEAKEFDPNTNQAGWHDYVVVNVHGTTGTLPMNDNGEPKPFAASGGPSPNDYNAFWHFPQIDPSQTNQNRWFAPGFEVLMNYDWCPAAAAGRARQAQAGCSSTQPAPGPGEPPPPGGPAGGQPPQQTTSTPLATVRSSRLRLRGSRVALRVKCDAPRTCVGRVRLKTRARRARTLGSRRIRIASGRTGTVNVALSRRNRRLIKPSGTRATVEVDLGTAGKVTRDVTISRR
jgi:hypothetical protein